MAMTWIAIAELGETPTPAVVGEIVDPVREMVAIFTRRHTKQTVASMRKCGVCDVFVFAALLRLWQKQQILVACHSLHSPIAMATEKISHKKSLHDHTNYQNIGTFLYSR